MKPRLLFFQFRYDSRLPEFLLLHKRDHVCSLQEHFHVTVLDGDCDYAQVCDRHTPDLVLFESGVSHVTDVTNLSSRNDIPKLGLSNQDSFGDARAGFLSDMDHWGIEHFFSIATTAPENMPEVCDRMFIWPNSVDPSLYRDYGEPKRVPILITGNTGSPYPWRRRVIPRLAERYLNQMCPHPGYNPGVGNQTLHGESFARALNCARIVPTCATFCRAAWQRVNWELARSKVIAG